MRTLWSPHSTSSSGSSMARVSNSLSKNTRPAQEELATITRSIRSSMKSVASPHKPRSISCGQRHIVNRSTRSDHIVRKSPSRPRSQRNRLRTWISLSSRFVSQKQKEYSSNSSQKRWSVKPLGPALMRARTDWRDHMDLADLMEMADAAV